MYKHKERIYSAIDDKHNGGIKNFTFLDEHAFKKLNEQSYGIFVSINNFKEKRQKQYLSGINALAFDFDIHHTKARDALKKLTGELPPTFIVKTRNGFHPYWQLKETLVVNNENREQVTEDYERTVGKMITWTKGFGNKGDATTDVTRVLRLPEYNHHKEQPFMVKEFDTGGLLYDFEKLVNYFDIMDVEPVKHADHARFQEGFADGWPEGGRNEKMFNFALSLLRAMPKSDWEHAWESMQNYWKAHYEGKPEGKDFSMEEVRRVFDSACNYQKKDNLSLKLGQIDIIKNDTGYVAKTPIKNGYLYCEFTELSYSARSVRSVLRLRLDTEDGESSPYVKRIDIRSNNAVRSFVTSLNNAFGGKKEGYNWDLLMNNIIGTLEGKIKQEFTIVRTAEHAYTKPDFLLSPFLQENAPTLIFADSETGKSWLALRLALSLASGTPFLGFESPSGKNTLYLDYEDTEKAFSSRAHMLCAGAGLDYKSMMGHIGFYKPFGSVRDYAEIIRKMVIEYKIDLLIIDAGGDACGGSPSDEERVIDFFNALEGMPCTKLILHHSPKYVQSEIGSYYGSQYWRSRARIGWRLQLESEFDGSITVKATLNKKSNLPSMPPIYYIQEYASEDSVPKGQPPPVTLDVQVGYVSPDKQAQNDAIEDTLNVLRNHPEKKMKAPAIAALLKTDAGTIRVQLNRMAAKGIVEKIGGPQGFWTAVEKDGFL